MFKYKAVKSNKNKHFDIKATGRLNSKVFLEKEVFSPFGPFAFGSTSLGQGGHPAGGAESPMVQVSVLEVEDLVFCGAGAEVICRVTTSLHTAAC